MSTSYESWARYDVDSELKRVDEQEQVEQVLKQQQQKVTQKRLAEDAISLNAEHSADVLAAHAAVAALKAKRNRTLSQSALPGRQEDGHVAVGTGAAVAVVVAAPMDDHGDRTTAVEKLHRQAACLQQKHELIKQITEARRAGTQMHGDGEYDTACGQFDQALVSTDLLARLVPELIEVEKEVAAIIQSKKRDADDRNKIDGQGDMNSVKTCSHAEYQDHPPDHRGCCHSHEVTPTASKQLKTSEEILPSAEDLHAVVAMFQRDCLLGLGSSELARGHLAAASEAFKEVLLKDPSHLRAWMLRGQVFEAMDAPLLAWLHYNRVSSLDPANNDAKEAEQRIKLILSGPVESDTSAATTSTFTTADTAPSLKITLTKVQLQLEEANVVMVEGFHAYAAAKYEAALLKLNDVLTVTEKNGAVGIVVTKLRRACHLNIANCYYEMQSHYPKALRHCQSVLSEDSSHLAANLRAAQIHRALHNYEKSLEHLKVAQRANELRPKDSKGHHKQQQIIAHEVDRYEYERSQYDIAYIRQEMRTHLP